MKLFYGAAIQGAKDRGERAFINRAVIELIKSEGYDVVSEHTTGRSKEETAELLERAIGPLPPSGPQRTIYVRRKMIESIEGDIDAAIFEVSIPSIGTGIEIAYACLRPRKGLTEIPILTLYQRDYWSNGLSSMVKGITPEELPKFYLKDYENLDNAKLYVTEFLRRLSKPLSA
ncbi:MAG: hypothetical protein NT120_04895 [Candidatus Aenigmarchaeota archaeon]|nr:hypothetical protein [Candidatus Aenigmarchaeota archaeon]